MSKVLDGVDKLILKAADVMEKQGRIKFTLGKPNGPVCIQGSILVAEGAVITAEGGWSKFEPDTEVGRKAEEKLNEAFGGKASGSICSFNNQDCSDAHIVASMRAVANGEPLPEYKKP